MVGVFMDSPSNMGLLDPHTSDGRVIFFLPWQHATMAGKTVASLIELLGRINCIRCRLLSSMITAPVCLSHGFTEQNRLNGLTFCLV